MRLLVYAVVIAAATPALAETPVPLRNDSGAIARSWDFRPTSRCPRPTLQHTQGPTVRPVQPLGALPPAYRLHAVDRRVDGCAVYPEAQRISDREGKLKRAAPR